MKCTRCGMERDTASTRIITTVKDGICDASRWDLCPECDEAFMEFFQLPYMNPSIRSGAPEKSEKLERAQPERFIRKDSGTRESWNAEHRPDGYHGFLFLRCPACGDTRGFCTKGYMTECKCAACGETYPLKDLIPCFVSCDCCGRTFKYKSNIDTDEFVEIKCLDCSAPVTLIRNRRGDAIVTVHDRANRPTRSPKKYKRGEVQDDE